MYKEELKTIVAEANACDLDIIFSALMLLAPPEP